MRPSRPTHLRSLQRDVAEFAISDRTDLREVRKSTFQFESPCQFDGPKTRTCYGLVGPLLSERRVLAVNRDKPDFWKADIQRSVDMFNQWFMEFAPEAYRSTRLKTTKDVEDTLACTSNLRDVGPQVLRSNPRSISTLRMSTIPPIAVDRLIGLSGVPRNLVKSMEKGKLPQRMPHADMEQHLATIGALVEKMADPDIFVWLRRGDEPDEAEIYRAATIVADRLCGSVADPIIRNAQESRQLAEIAAWLETRGYREVTPENGQRFDELPDGSYSFHVNVPAQLTEERSVNITVDAVVTPGGRAPSDLPLLIEAKSAGDFTNVNKRRKEEATKMSQLRNTYGPGVPYILFLCGYFDTGYLGYEAAEGIDWVWEHRIDDLANFGV